jgi:hypothetical protein
MKPEECDGWCIFDGDGNEVARFTGKQFRARQGESGEIVVYAMPVSSSAQTQDNDYRPCRDTTAHAQRLAGVNQRNQDFWRARAED